MITKETEQTTGDRTYALNFEGCLSKIARLFLLSNLFQKNIYIFRIAYT